jgi:hypothetical protein
MRKRDWRRREEAGMTHPFRRTVQFISLVLLMTTDRGVSIDPDRQLRVLKTGNELPKKAVIEKSEQTMQMSPSNRQSKNKTGYNAPYKPPRNHQKGEAYSNEYDAHDIYGKQYRDNQHMEKLLALVKTEEEKRTMQEEAAFWERLLARRHHKPTYVEMSITAAPTKAPIQAAPSPAPITSTPAPSKLSFVFF